MIQFAEAVECVLQHVPALQVERVSLAEACGRVLAEAVTAKVDSPRFDSSSVDGFTVIAQDCQESPELRIAETIAAGKLATQSVPSGHTARILTGAVVPIGCDAVVMKELCNERNGNVLIGSAPSPGENIRKQGDEFGTGELLLNAGTILSPGPIALLALNGLTEILVFTQPRVALITTGDEIVEPGEQLQPGHVYNANRWGLYAALVSLKIKPVSVQHVRDNALELLNIIRDVQESAEIIITAGGVSEGDTDHVRSVMQTLGWEIHFNQVAIKPGKPTCFGTLGERRWFGLPGNPVSALVSFHHFVRPLLLRISGRTKSMPKITSAVLTKPLVKKPGRMEFVRGRVHETAEGLQVLPHSGRESHMLTSLISSDCLIHFPQDAEYVAVGERVEIEILSW